MSCPRDGTASSIGKFRGNSRPVDLAVSVVGKLPVLEARHNGVVIWKILALESSYIESAIEMHALAIDNEVILIPEETLPGGGLDTAALRVGEVAVPGTSGNYLAGQQCNGVRDAIYATRRFAVECYSWRMVEAKGIVRWVFHLLQESG